MINIIDGVKQYTNYRKDFTPEERIAYNAYVKGRMNIYFKTDKGKAKARECSKKHYYKIKDEKINNEKINNEKINDTLVKVDNDTLVKVDIKVDNNTLVKVDTLVKVKKYRKNFTQEERTAHNLYSKERMGVYFRTEKGKAKAVEHSRKQYLRKKEKKINDALEKIE